MFRRNTQKRSSLQKKMRKWLCVLLVTPAAVGFDLTWIPADPEGPLPLSQAFRDQLSKLCDIIDGGGPMPPTIEARLADLKKMCAKLRNEVPERSVMKPILAAVSTAIVGAWAWNSYETKGLVYKIIQDHRKKQRRAAIARRRAQRQLYATANPPFYSKK